MTYFSDNELCCRCGCGRIGGDLRDLLDSVREEFGAPMIITSGYRCENHPIEAAKNVPGPHSSGVAADIAVHGADAYRLVEIALRIGATGIGVSQKGDISQRFIHLDWCENGPNRPRPLIWSY